MQDLTRSDALDRQLAFLHDRAESWVPAHDVAMACFELEATIAMSLTTFGSLKRFTELFNESAKQRGVGFDEASARQIQKRYIDWYESSERFLKELRRVEAAGHRIARSGEFIEACQDARLCAFELDRVTAAMDQFSRGSRGKSLAEARDELRRRAV